MDEQRSGMPASLDRLTRTSGRLARAIGHAGSARSEAERLPSLYEANGVTVGHISYTYGTNGIPAPVPWMNAQSCSFMVASENNRASRVSMLMNESASSSSDTCV